MIFLFLLCHHRLFLTKLETDSLVFFFHGSFALKYAALSNQRVTFLHGSLVYEYIQSTQSNRGGRIRTTAKNLRNKRKLFS